MEPDELDVKNGVSGAGTGALADTGERWVLTFGVVMGGCSMECASDASAVCVARNNDCRMKYQANVSFENPLGQNIDMTYHVQHPTLQPRTTGLTAQNHHPGEIDCDSYHLNLLHGTTTFTLTFLCSYL